MSDGSNGVIKVRISKVLPEKRWRILRMITRVHRFPEYMPHVKTAEILERHQDYAITYWKIDLDGFLIKWKEKDEFDFRNFKIHFKAFDGDLERFEGCWILNQHPKGTEVIVEVEAQVGIPGVDQILFPVIEEKLKGNFARMLECLNNKIVSDHYISFKKGDRTKVGGFAILGHPYNLNNLVRYLKFLKFEFAPPSQQFLKKLYELMPSFVMHDVEEFTSEAGTKSRGLVIMSTFIPDMIATNPQFVFSKVVEACRVAENHNIGIAALGGFTSIVGERYGDELRKNVHIPLTTGNTFTVALAIEGIRKACRQMELNMKDLTACVIGGTGDIGSGCAHILAQETKEVIITGRTPKNIKALVNKLKKIRGAKIDGSTDNVKAVRKADIVIAAASGTQSLLNENAFKPGAIVCDLAYPKNISHAAEERRDILVFSGGLAEIPQEIDMGFEIGLPSPKTLYGCFSEAILLALERRYESFSYGKGNITPEKVEEIKLIGEKHGFRVAPFYSGDRLFTQEDFSLLKLARNGKKK